MKTAVSCILLLLLSSVFVEGLMVHNGGGKGRRMKILDQDMERNVVPVHNTGKRGMQMRDQDVDRNVELTSHNNGKRVMQERRDSQYRRNLCLYARELDCDRELQEK
ncbi:hypothetical protein OS493_029002 [Desmophyllum pertusum]|uniref:Uncharacterized protein n=1 Tax=Desmophyllum pertusum TaxID=174260 RepID=A0A9W9YWU8_9CNID|nr:hypothetical protein OS493_029002 [Desmophyllum pertusum]